jgi:DNA segregation ATPase FtsK/SpoIIIE-like protein
VADKITHAGGLILRGIVPPDEALAQRREYWEGQLLRAQRQLARPDATVGISYWQGSRRLHPDCEARPTVPGVRPEGASPLGGDRGLLLEAAELAIDRQHASASFLQRNLQVGFVKAGRLMQLLQERGVVGPAHDASERDVLVPCEGKARALAAIQSEVDDD